MQNLFNKMSGSSPARVTVRGFKEGKMGGNGGSCVFYGPSQGGRQRVEREKNRVGGLIYLLKHRNTHINFFVHVV